MSRGIKIGIIAAGIVVVLPIVAIGMLFVGMSQFEPSPTVRQEMVLANHGSLIIDGNERSQSEHGFSQSAGYRPPGSAEIEWFGDVSDGVEPQVYQAGPLLVVIDLPAACLFVRNPNCQEKWKSLALVFPNDLGPFPIFLLRGKEWSDDGGGLADQRAGRQTGAKVSDNLRPKLRPRDA
jgi:hypothetical protein